jgi:hypothetical protein
VNRRAVIAVVVLTAWAGGLAALLKKEFLKPPVEHLAEAALRVNPSAVFYAVIRDGRQIGYASRTIDTVQAGITATDLFVAEIGEAGSTRRVTARTRVLLSRIFRVKGFEISSDIAGPMTRTVGTFEGDSAVVLSITQGTGAATTQRVPLAEPVLLPSLVPMALALGQTLKRSRSFTLPVFDPDARAVRRIDLRVHADSSFVVYDSAMLDRATNRWRGLLPDTVAGWRVTATDSAGFSGWLDEQGQVLVARQFGSDLVRRPYEEAFGNWQLQSQDAAAPASASGRNALLESTIIAANRRAAVHPLTTLTVRLRDRSGQRLDIDGDRQRLRGDTLVIKRETDADLVTRVRLPFGRSISAAVLGSDSLIQSTAPAIAALASRLRGRDRDLRLVAERINRWVHDSVAASTISANSALDVLTTRTGDAPEQAALFVAIARASGISSRVVAGFVLIDDRFYFHAWPEIQIQTGRWVAVDPTLGQFPADASHIRLMVGGLPRQSELFRRIGPLAIDVISAR